MLPNRLSNRIRGSLRIMAALNTIQFISIGKSVRESLRGIDSTWKNIANSITSVLILWGVHRALWGRYCGSFWWFSGLARRFCRAWLEKYAECRVFSNTADRCAVSVYSCAGFVAGRYTGAKLFFASAIVRGDIFIMGIVLFSGSLYVLVLTSFKPGLITPIGGSLLVLGWFSLACSAWRKA